MKHTFVPIACICLILNGCDADTTINTNIPETSGNLPSQIQLEAPYPNPFSSTTVAQIRFISGEIRNVVVQNPLGDVVKTLIFQKTAVARIYQVVWNGTNEENKPSKLVSIL
jgi:hypothetical protein